MAKPAYPLVSLFCLIFGAACWFSSTPGGNHSQPTQPNGLLLANGMDKMRVAGISTKTLQQGIVAAAPNYIWWGFLYVEFSSVFK
jgi:hypothetical protein